MSSAATSSPASEEGKLGIAVVVEGRIESSSDSIVARVGVRRRRKHVDRREEERRWGRTWNDGVVERERIVEVVDAASVADTAAAAERRPARSATPAKKVGTARRSSGRAVERIRSDSHSSPVVRWRILATLHEAE